MNHSAKEYVKQVVEGTKIKHRGELLQHPEGGGNGVYYHWSRQHLHRDVADALRATRAIEGIEGKRLM